MAANPYLRRGEEILSDDSPTTSPQAAPAPATPSPTAAPDPHLQRGEEILSTPTPAPAPPLQVGNLDPNGQASYSPDWTWRGLARQAGGAAVRTGANIANIFSDPSANLIGRPLLTVGQAAYDTFAPMLGGNRLTDEQRNALYEDFNNQPGTRAVNAVGSRIGVDPYNVPGTPSEKSAGSVMEGAATAAALGGGGIAPAVAGGTGVVGGQLAADNVPDYLKPAAELAGNIAGAKVGNMATSLGTRGVGAVTGAKTPVAAAYDELGIDRRLLGDLTENPTARLAQAYSSKSPGGSSVVNPIEQKVVGQFGQAVEDTAKRLGASTSEQTAGEVLQREARNWKDVVFPQRQGQAWAPVDQMLGNESVAPGNYRTALTSLTGKLAGLPDTQKALVPGKVWELLDAIDKDVPAGQAMPWQQAQALRSAIGQVMGVPEIVQSVGKDQLSRAYGGISQDMRDTAARVDAANAAATAAGGPVMPSAVDAFTKANKVSTDGHAFIDNTLSKIIRANNPAQETIAPEKATRSVLGSGDTTLEALRREMPTATDELAGYKLRDMALATPGAAGRTGGETSVSSFLTDLNRLRQQMPAGFRALYSDPVVARKVDAMSTVADTIKETAKRANTSGTGPYQTIAQVGPSMYATWQATHNPYWTAGSAAAPLVANRGIALGVTNPFAARLASAPGPRSLPNPLLTGLVIGNNQNPLVSP
jgi:hypothetical protein